MALAANLIAGVAVGTALLAFSGSGLAWRPAPEAPELAFRWTPALRTVAEQRAAAVHGLLQLLRATTLLLLAAVCANLLFRLLDHATERRAEVQLRAALGATPAGTLRSALRGPGRVILAAAGAGILLGTLLLRGLTASWPGGAGRLLAPLGWRAVALGALAPAGLALACIALPAAMAARRNLADTLQVGTHATAGPMQMLLRRLMARGQFTLSLALAACAGLLLRGAGGSAGGSDVARPAEVRTYAMDLTGARVPERLGEAQAGLRRRLGARGAAFATASAWSGEGPEDVVTAFCRPACAEGGMLLPILRRPARMAAVGADHFAALGIPLVAGRTLGDQDGPGAEPVVVVSRRAGYRLFPARNPVGQHLTPGIASPFGGGEVIYRVVGVVDDVQVAGAPVAPGPMVYFSVRQHPPRRVGLAVRGNAPVTATLRAAGLSAAPAGRLDARYARLTEPSRWSAGLLAGLAGLAVLLCGYGLHGVVAAAMAARTREIGVRMALGATPRRILRLALDESLRIARTGTLIGALLSLAVAGGLRQSFAGLPWADPLALVAAVLLMAAIAVVACWRPAARAAATEPKQALKRG